MQHFDRCAATPSSTKASPLPRLQPIEGVAQESVPPKRRFIEPHWRIAVNCDPPLHKEGVMPIQLWSTFRLKRDATYDQRYAAMVKAFDEVGSNFWTEPTSFYAF